MRKWHVALLGRHVKVHTDHKALKFLTSCADDSSRITRWIAFLREFDLDIEHIPGKENTIADTLSRDNVKNGSVNKESLLRSIAAINCPDDQIETSQWVDYIAREQQNDEPLVRECQDNPDIYAIRNELIRVKIDNKGERIPVPENAKWNLLRRIHLYLMHFGTLGNRVCEEILRY